LIFASTAQRLGRSNNRANHFVYDFPMQCSFRLLAAGAALGATFCLQASAATQPKAVLGKAKLVVSAKVGNGFYAHVWLSPSSNGGECRFVTTDSVARPIRPATFENGGCSGNGAPAVQAAPISVGLSIVRRPAGKAAASWAPPIVSGSVATGLKAAKVAVRWAGGSLPLVLRNGAFVGGGIELYAPSLKSLPYRVVAYDGRGHVLAAEELDGASLELMNPQKFASAYAGFQKSRKH
jgi:hypothetical protein